MIFELRFFSEDRSLVRLNNARPASSRWLLLLINTYFFKVAVPTRENAHSVRTIFVQHPKVGVHLLLFSELKDKICLSRSDRPVKQTQSGNT